MTAFLLFVALIALAGKRLGPIGTWVRWALMLAAVLGGNALYFGYLLSEFWRARK